MTVESPVRVMSPEEIVARGGGTTQRLVLPDRATLFAERSLRLRQLAAGHAMRDYLIFVADIASAQQRALASFPSVSLPDAAAVDEAGLAGEPPLEAGQWPRDAAWRAALAQIVADVRPRAPVPVHATLDAIDAWLQRDTDELERQADRLLNGVMLGLDLGAAPLVASALQVYWTHLLLETQRLHADARHAPIDRIDATGACPCCGSRPTSSITRLASDTPGQRYLHCSLCSLQWHLVRVTCSHCNGGSKIAYQTLEARAAEATNGARAAIQAETCDDCGHYLKIVHMEKDPQVDPVADDLASLTLDLLVAETGKQRHGVNLMLLFGDPEAAPPPDPGGGG